MVTVVNPPKTKHTNCSRCRAELAFTYNDTKERVSTDYLGGRDTVRYIVCPCCNHNVTVSVNQ